MKILLLHLSDIHFQTHSDKALSQPEYIAAAAVPRLNGTKRVFVVVSGDIAYSGSQEQYQIAHLFFEKLRAALTEKTNSPIHFIFTPGNHDCDFSGNQSVRQTLINSILKRETDLDPEIIAQCVKVQKYFFDFRNSWEPIGSNSKDPLWTTYNFELDGRRIIFDCINVSWMSQLREEQGKLVFPVEPYENLGLDASEIRIVVMHHPLNWYNQATYRPFRRLIRNLAEIVITGHEHEQNAGENQDVESDKSVYIEGGVLQASNGTSAASFNLIELDLSEQQYACEFHSWTGALFEPQEAAAWQNYRLLPKKTRNELSLTEEFSDQLDDPGGAFSHPGKQKIRLSDIYVFPDLRRRGQRNQKVRDTINSSFLRDIEILKKGVLLKGDKKTGRTSLIYQLFKYFHESGFAPLLLNGAEIKATSRELSKAIEKSATRQYKPDALKKFKQISSAQKVALVDDFDAQKLTNSQRADLLTLLRAEFGGILLTVSELFELDEVISEGGIPAIVGFTEYELLEFGYKLRFELIRKWSSLGNGSGRDSTDIFNMLDQTEKSLNAIIGRNLVPRVPIYLLILLQSLELGQSAELQNSAHGDCYRFLITGAFARAGVKSVEMQEYLQFCSLLSWEYCKHEVKELDENKLAEFHDWFSKQYYRRDFQKRIELLIHCHILDRRGEYYSFRYPYIYYFFLGKYLSDNLQNIAQA